MSSRLTIGQLSTRAGISPSAIRFYEGRGLITSERTSGNQRRYAPITLRRIAFIRTAQRVGLSLEEISRALAGLPGRRTPTAADWQRLSAAWRARLDEQIRRTELLRDRLDSCIGCGCLSLGSCALANPGDELAEHGPGPVRLDPHRDAPGAAPTP